MAAICDRPEFQRLLPQVVLVGENQQSQERYELIRQSAPECVRIWRRPTAWMSDTLMVQYIRLLGSCLRDFVQSHRFILYMGAHMGA